jgi:predicted secreted hydrolase
MKKRSLSRVVPFLLVAVLVLAGVLASYPITSQADGNVVLPADESAHPNSAMEWWYFTGHLNGTDIFGRHHQYGFEETMIRMDLLGTEPVAAIYSGHLAISDLTRGTFKMDMSTFGFQPDVVPCGGGFNNTVGTLHMDGKNGVNHINAAGFSDLSYTLINLTLSQSAPSALHGVSGLIPYGPFGTSYYYSQTRLNVTGTLFDHGVLVFVTGIAWQDHQWGDFNGVGGWEWFSIQLPNNTQYMLYFINDASEQIVQKVGTLVNADGTTVNLDPNSISMTPLGTWTSPHTGITFHQNWTVTVPGGTLTVTPQIIDQELYSSLMPTGSYWEGTCTVTGTINGQAVTAQGYTEITPTFTLPISLIDTLKAIFGL